jgi:zeaxanthin glucosyltransferase
MRAIGRELQMRGHQLTLFHLSDLAKPALTEISASEPIERSAVSFANSGDASVARTTGSTQDAFLHYMVKRARWICENAPALLAAAKLDCLLADALDPATATVGEMLQIPYATINNALPLNTEPLVPPDFLPWQFHDTWWARLRNAFAYKVRDLLISPLNRTLNGYRRQWNLRPYRTPADSLSPLAQITQLVREFDLPHTRLPKCFHYVGPYHRESDSQHGFPYDQLNSRPLVYASLGTRQSVYSPLWREISESCAGLDVQLVIALGNRNGSQAMSPLPGNPVTVDYAPQVDLLARARLAILHGGLNSTMEALAAGVPIIALPLIGDQFGVAARVAYTGAGETIAGSRCHAIGLRPLIKTVLEGSSYREHARDLKFAINQTAGSRRAADILEEVAATRRPVLT